MPILGGVHAIRTTSSHVLAPGQQAQLALAVENRNDAAVRVTIHEHLPPGWTAQGTAGLGPVTLAPGGQAKASYAVVAPASEGPALIAGTLTVEHEGAPALTLALETPVACYPPHPVEAPEQLAAVRDRLVAVTNFHARNGHVLLLDPAEYFLHHLNVPLTDAMQKMIALEFGFTKVGVPVARAVLDQVRVGDNKGVLGVARVELEADVDDACDRTYEPHHAAAFRPEVRS